MENNNELKIITDETLMEKRNHGQPAFPFQYYLEDIWDFDFHTLGWHWHQEIEFVYVQSGEAHCCVGKDRFSLPAGSGLFINTKILHQFTAEHPTVIPNIVFSPVLLASPESFVYQQYVKPLLVSDIPYLVFEPLSLWHKEILSLLNQVFKTQEQPNFRELTTLRLLTSIWEVLYENMESRLQQGQPVKRDLNASRLQMMMSFIHSHYADQISLADIANFAHVSNNSCMQIFKNGIRQSPVSYLIQYRLKKAAELLANTEMKAAVISEECGFHDVPYFYRKYPFADWETAEPGDIIGGFTTLYGKQQGHGKAAAREHNISEGVKRIDGVAVEREETFSFNALCAPYRHSNGYELAPNVSTDGFGYGGGVCQVTTTLYNAALTLPLQIEEWALHSKQGAVYVPQFFDAAVGNYSDFTFVNLLPYGVQIHASAQNGVLTVLFCRAEEDSQ